MEYEKPANGVLKRGEWGDSLSYQVFCECGDPEHSHYMFVEAEDTGVNVTIYTQINSKWWEKNRWRQIWSLLTKGHIEAESSIYLTQQQAFNYACTLKQAVDDVETFRKNGKSNKN